VETMARIRAEAPYERQRERERQTQREITMHKAATYKNIINSTKITYLEVSGKFLYELKC